MLKKVEYKIETNSFLENILKCYFTNENTILDILHFSVLQINGNDKFNLNLFMFK